MNVSANIIRFPAAPALAERKVAAKVEADNVVSFPAWPGEDHGINADAQKHGQMFAAERIIARVADQLDAIAAL